MTAQQKIGDLPFPVDEIEICVFDIFDNSYVLTQENKLFKISSDGIQAEYQVPFGYSIFQMGLNHIHKLYLFSKDQQTVIFLDNQLTELSTISFEALGYYNVTSIDLSEEDRLWFIDADKRELVELPTINAQLSTTFAVREIDKNLEDFHLRESVNGISILNDNERYVYSLTGQFLHYFSAEPQTIIDEKANAYVIRDHSLWKVEPLMPSDVKLSDLPADSAVWLFASIYKNSLYYLHNKGCYKRNIYTD